jgi:hypothetical protein
MAEKVIQELIDEGTARAEKVACAPGTDRCSPLPHREERWGAEGVSSGSPRLSAVWNRGRAGPLVDLG